MDSRYTWEFPSREEINASDLLSGDHAGAESWPLCVSCIAGPPTAGTTQILLALRLASMSGVATEQAIHFPSGEIVGLAMRWMLLRSSKVIGRLLALSCANVARQAPPNITATNPHRSAANFMRFSLCVTSEICFAGLRIVSRFMHDAKVLSLVRPSFRCCARRNWESNACKKECLESLPEFGTMRLTAKALVVAHQHPVQCCDYDDAENDRQIAERRLHKQHYAKR